MPTQKKAAAAEAAPPKAQAEPVTDATSLLKEDHRKVLALFERCKAATAPQEKAQLAREICKELIIHTLLEEEIFYQSCREHGVEQENMDEAQVEHDGAKVLIAELLTATPESEFYDAKVAVLAEYIRHHVGEEEKPGDGIFAKAQTAGVDMSALGQRLEARKKELTAKPEAELLVPPVTRSLHINLSSDTNKEKDMAQHTEYRDRDDRGRFMSEEDDDRRSSRRYGSRSRYEDDDDDRSSRARERERDEEGRFVPEDDRRRSRGRSEERDDDDDRSYGGGRGWYGDSEEHAEAARERWEGRGSSRSGRGRGDDEDDDRRSGGGHGGWYGDSEGHAEAARQRSESRGGSYRSGRGRDDDEDDHRRSGRGHGGWFGDPEGHSEAARQRGESRGGSYRSGRGRDDDEDDRRSGRGHGGWYGDSEGHAEAARQRSESRGSSRSGRGRDDDEDDRRRSNGDHRGWYGDSRGHAQAARRGWQNRD